MEMKDSGKALSASRNDNNQVVSNIPNQNSSKKSEDDSDDGLNINTSTHSSSNYGIYISSSYPIKTSKRKSGFGETSHSRFEEPSKVTGKEKNPL
ncbi:hypothetical protein O181_118254 [Austropuccinia psidii MF-1]|uniref:Uncharacterized protein n=1 Tax=Austropuccinia psidii MF-1 TaxID=1389203 RepID=A0A9Q3PYA6_9BASI|nr:hypothetical protein [Austropuccinia psidii MF-1]